MSGKADMINFCYGDPNVDWFNKDLFYEYKYWEETSWFDESENKRWNGGLECYEVCVRVRVPKVFEHCETARDMWIDWMIDNYPDHKYFWVNNG
jgi:hypothetical protein